MPAPQSEDFPRLGRYQVINKIASGGMAEVFLARATGAMGFQRLVAVKLIHANFTRDQEFVKMFIDEARISMHLHHRNIVQVFDLDKVGDTYFIAMEFVHGVNLYDVYERIASKNRWIEPPMALYLVAEISKGLHFAHTRPGADGRPLGIVHRDISPQNVLLSFEGEVKIMDFGIATAAERLHQTAAGIVKGKYAYMAPERLQEQPTDARVDVFSVGVLLYELLCGENPFAGPSAVETIENVLEKEIPPPSERGARVGRGLDEICLKALARDPNQRYRSAQALADAVTEYAMELTHARKDMAAGDQAVATLLHELFPEKAKHQPGAADPKGINLPGVKPGAANPVKSAPASTGIKVSTIDTSSDPTGPDQKSANDFLETQESLDEELVKQAMAEDYDAPTLMKMSPLDATAPQLIDYDEPGTMKSQSALDDSGMMTVPPRDQYRNDSNLHSIETPRDASTGPTDLPIPPSKNSDPTLLGGMQAVGGFQIVKSSNATEDPYARTFQSQAGLKTIEEAPMEMQAMHSPAPRVSGPTSDPGRPMPSRMTPPPSPGPMMSGALDQSSSEQLVVPVSLHAMDPATQPRRSLLNVLAGAMLLLAVLVVGAAVFVVRGGERALVEVGVQINTTPSDAKVIVNGRDHPRLTPTTINVLAEQVVHVEITRPGYETVVKDLTPRAGDAPVINEVLRAISGTLTLAPSPPEVRSLVDGVDKGTGKKALPELPLNRPITVTFESEGYDSFTQLVTLTEQTPNRKIEKVLNKSAKPHRPGKTVAVALQAPPGRWATVLFEGKELGTTPISAAQLPPGRIELIVKTPEGQEKKLSLIVPTTPGDVLLDF